MQIKETLNKLYDPLLIFLKTKKKLIYICSVFLAIYIIVESTGLRSIFSVSKIKDLFFQYPVGGVFLFCMIFSLGNLLYIPGLVFLVGAVWGLGKEWGGIVTYIAAIFSSALSFYIIISISGDALRSIENKYAKKIFSQLDSKPIISITILRLILQTAPALNYALAMSKVQFRHYIIGTILGLPIPIFAYCYFFELIFKHVFIETSN